MNPPKTSNYFIGLMSGTSMDGVDGVVAQIKGDACKVLAHHSLPFPQALKDEFLALNTPTDNELHRGALATNALVDLYAQVVAGLMYSAELESDQICAIGAHGQTVRHRPELGYTWQLNNPARLAERTGIAVVADFRSRDIAAGGQGAPLVPAFHKAVFGQAAKDIAILNIGGIANLSLLSADGSVLGFDTGPGNVLMDAWINQCTNLAYDKDGSFAASGEVISPLLHRLLAEPYFSQPIPKSTGRDVFHLAWLQAHVDFLSNLNPLLINTYAPACVQATLVELTAQSVAQAMSKYASSYKQLYVCGGGAFNYFLMRRLQLALPQIDVQSTQTLGIPPMQVEATAFAWLAAKCMHGETLAMQKVTGSKAPLIYGAVYPA